MIGPFRGKYRFLSNFWESEIHLPGSVSATEDVIQLWPGLTWADGVVFRSVEHAFQGAKAETPEDLRRILACRTPGEAKRVGRSLRREGWMSLRSQVMRLLLQEKFEQNKDLAEKLRKTGKEDLVEINSWHDTFWGQCQCPRCMGGGENVLGQMLMDIRESL